MAWSWWFEEDGLIQDNKNIHLTKPVLYNI